MAAITGLGVGGPSRAYGVFTAKSIAAVAATRITRLGLGGPMMPYNQGDPFAAKAESGVIEGVFNYPIYRRSRRS